ncbi:MAG: DUF3006 domain-containing protein [Oscillospiraceae bacterium]|nr:DUF3006 domain-containing protein [Oscillospiraceae bacterium]
MLMIVDRIEDDIAVIEETGAPGEITMKKLPLLWLPEDVSEGDVIRRTADGWVIDKEETAKRRLAAAAEIGALTDDADDI